jgi:hypothetical protein
LRGADLRGAYLEGASLPNFQICPEIGSFYAWKKLSNNIIAKIYIPAKAARTSSLIGRKCRASEAKIVSASYSDGSVAPKGTKIRSWRDSCSHTVGETMYPDSYDDDIRLECTHGIHFFMTEKEAREW